MRFALLCLLAPFALVELLFYQRYDLIVLGGLVLGLTMQAEWSAARALRRESEPVTEEPVPEEELDLKVPPLGGRRATDRGGGEPNYAAQVVSATRVNDPEGLQVKRAPSLPAAPNFRGPAHEVLGVSENAHTRTIVNAFRHWVKRFHPDMAKGLPASLANDRVHKLTEAKELLLDRRKTRKAA